MARFGATPQSLRQGSFIAVTAIAVATVSAMIFANGAFALQSPVDRGLTKSFAVLAGTGITNTGATVVSGTAGGNMGSAPTTSFPGEAQVTTNGVKYTAPSSVVDNAKTALITVYNDVAGRTPVTTTVSDVTGMTLTEGVYTSGSAILLTGSLTLDAQNNPDAVFIFQAGSELTTMSGSSVNMINGAQACNVFWQVGSDAVFGTNSDFIGHVLALTSITAATGAEFNGSLQARNGTVTLDTNVITNDLCDEENAGSGGGNSLSDTGVSPELTILGGGLAIAAVVVGVTAAIRRRRSI